MDRALNGGASFPGRAPRETLIARTRVGRSMARSGNAVERWMLDLQADRPRLARYLTIAWWVSNAFLLVGVVMAFLIYAGVWRP